MMPPSVNLRIEKRLFRLLTNDRSLSPFCQPGVKLTYSGGAILMVRIKLKEDCHENRRISILVILIGIGDRMRPGLRTAATGGCSPKTNRKSAPTKRLKS
jgi:hypothetical protein